MGNQIRRGLVVGEVMNPIVESILNNIEKVMIGKRNVARIKYCGFISRRTCFA